MENEGKKFDYGKPRYDLVPMDALEEVAKILTHGAQKYEDDNWQKVKPFDKRYRSALWRHDKLRTCGELIDKESGLLHSAHMATNALFLVWKDLQELNKKRNTNRITNSC